MQELVLSEDPATGEITRLTRFLPGADTAAFGGKAHPFPEEIFIVAGRLFDAAFGLWLESGHYASRPPGEVHGPFRTDGAGRRRHDMDRSWRGCRASSSAWVKRGVMNCGQFQ